MDKDESPQTAPEAGPATAGMAESVPSSPVPARRGAALPMVLAGAIVAAAGVGGGYFLRDVLDAGIADNLATQDARIADIESELMVQPDPVDLTPIQQALAEIADAQNTATADLAKLRDEVTALSALPAPDQSVSAIAFAAMQSRLAEISARFDALKTETESRVTSAIDTAQAARDNIAQDSRVAAATEALARLKTAFADAGDMAAPIADLAQNGVTVPQSVVDAVDGLPTLSDLRTQYPAAARAALSAARDAGVSGETGNAFVNFLRSTLDIRSVTAQAGDSVDAVLSRAEAALGSGQLAAALDELAALPPEAAAKMQDWLAAARNRIDVGAAIDALLPPTAEN